MNVKRGSKTPAKRRDSRAKRPLKTSRPGPKDMIREVKQEGGVQLTESAVVDVDDEFSWY